jgi:hypothetical protein
MIGTARKRKPWVSVYKAPDEWHAHIARSWLLEEGIPAVVQSRMLPGFGTMMIVQTGYWGEVLVPEACLVAAEAVLDANLPEPDAEP